MSELAIYVYARSSKTFASLVTCDVISEGQRIKRFQERVLGEVKNSDVKKVAQAIQMQIDKNLKLGLKYDGSGKVAKLRPSTITRKKAKGRAEASRVFLDSGLLFTSLRLIPIGAGYSVTFKRLSYPKSKKTVMEVATYLNTGTTKMVARPFFGITQNQFGKLVSQYITPRRVKTAKVTAKQIIRIENRIGQIVSIRRVEEAAATTEATDGN